MDICKLLILQLIAHVLADYIFQTDLWTRHKRMYGFHSKILYWHFLIVFSLSWIMSFQLNFLIFSLVISLLHLVLDGFKFLISNFKIRRIRPFKEIVFFVDQFIHLIIITAAVFIFNKVLDIDAVLSFPVTNHHLLILLGYLVCLKPANIFIREVFKIYNLRLTNKSRFELSKDKKDNTQEDLLNAGKLIGNIERVLTLTLMLAGQYEAIGFIIAGKSILRYEGHKTAKTEYVLVGTLLSFGIAILVGMLIKKLGI
jgi:hypothetical protein